MLKGVKNESRKREYMYAGLSGIPALSFLPVQKALKVKVKEVRKGENEENYSHILSGDTSVQCFRWNSSCCECRESSEICRRLVSPASILTEDYAISNGDKDTKNASD